MRNIKIASLVFLLLFCLQTANAEWVKQTTNSFAWFRDVFFVNASKGWIVGDNGTVMATTDGGSTWTPSKKFTNDSIVQVHFLTEMNGWMLCQRDIYASAPTLRHILGERSTAVSHGRRWSFKTAAANA